MPERLTKLERELVSALAEAVAAIEGRPARSPWTAVEDWKATLAKADAIDRAGATNQGAAR